MNWRTMEWNKQPIGRRGEILTKDVYRCGFCKGTGLLPSKKGIKCPVCLGDGKVKVSSPAVICAYCKGTGRSRLNSNLTCLVCKGKGIVKVSSKLVEICPACKGRGREKGSDLPCLTCRGKGVIIKKEGEIPKSIEKKSTKRSEPLKKPEVSKKPKGLDLTSERKEVELALEKKEQNLVSKKKELDLTPEEIFQYIKEKAQNIWEEEGRLQGKDTDIWCRAEKEVLSQLCNR